MTTPAPDPIGQFKCGPLPERSANEAIARIQAQCRLAVGILSPKIRDLREDFIKAMADKSIAGSITPILDAYYELECHARELERQHTDCLADVIRLQTRIDGAVRAEVLPHHASKAACVVVYRLDEQRRLYSYVNKNVLIVEDDEPKTKGNEMNAPMTAQELAEFIHEQACKWTPDARTLPFDELAAGVRECYIVDAQAILDKLKEGGMLKEETAK
jgi:hypothetical protein